MTLTFHRGRFPRCFQGVHELSCRFDPIILAGLCSEKQAELIASFMKPEGRVWLMPDGNAAGERLAESLLLQISPHRLVRWVKLYEGQQPTDLSSLAEEQLASLKRGTRGPQRIAFLHVKA